MWRRWLRLRRSLSLINSYIGFRMRAPPRLRRRGALVLSLVGSSGTGVNRCQIGSLDAPTIAPDNAVVRGTQPVQASSFSARG